MREKIAKLRKLAAWAERYGLNDDEIIDIGVQSDALLTPQAVARIWPEAFDKPPVVASDRRGMHHFVFADGPYRVACVVSPEELAAIKARLAEVLEGSK